MAGTGDPKAMFSLDFDSTTKLELVKGDWLSNKSSQICVRASGDKDGGCYSLSLVAVSASGERLTLWSKVMHEKVEADYSAYKVLCMFACKDRVIIAMGGSFNIIDVWEIKFNGEGRLAYLKPARWSQVNGYRVAVTPDRVSVKIAAEASTDKIVIEVLDKIDPATSKTAKFVQKDGVWDFD